MDAAYTKLLEVGVQAISGGGPHMLLDRN
jgi:hypothetical protein